VARTIEDLRTHYKPFLLKTYAYAQDADPSANRVNFEILHIQVLDSAGNILASM
jgi:hypothetical protein